METPGSAQASPLTRAERAAYARIEAQERKAAIMAKRPTRAERKMAAEIEAQAKASEEARQRAALPAPVITLTDDDVRAKIEARMLEALAGDDDQNATAAARVLMMARGLDTTIAKGNADPVGEFVSRMQAAAEAQTQFQAAIVAEQPRAEITPYPPSICRPFKPEDMPQ